MGTLQDRGSELRREYMRNWRAKNRDRVREYNARYWAKRAEREAQNAHQKEGGEENE
ncbi:MAG TPA: hypothetical protein H9915_04070 [Candidatus Gemmiger faecigallinarum]|nr:hypothetical protein [Candidatus Gemmiger faecigallinarum]